MNKSCSLKSNQKLFILQNNQASSCCRAEQLTLDPTKSIDFYVIHWSHEKKLLDQGVELPGCEVCWAEERLGHQSLRQQSLRPHSLAENESTETIEIFLSNLCNQMCSYCSPKYSSEWHDSIQQMPFSGISNTTKQNLALTTTELQPDYWINQIKLYTDSCLDDSVVIRLLGGEPLMQLRTLEIFKKFNLKKIKRFDIITNLNAPSSKFLHWLINSVDRDKLRIKISVDATPEYNHIPRAKFNQVKFLENLSLLQSNQIDFRFLSVLSILNVVDLKNFLTWIKDNEFTVDVNPLNNPDCLSVQTLPFAVRQEILQSIEHLNPSDIIRNNLLDNRIVVDLKLFEQYNYLIQYFQRNNIDPLQINNRYFNQHWTDLERKFKK